MAYWAETVCSKSLNKEINKVGCDWFFFVELKSKSNDGKFYEGRHLFLRAFRN
jgi:hypothetical protein